MEGFVRDRIEIRRWSKGHSGMEDAGGLPTLQPYE